MLDGPEIRSKSVRYQGPEHAPRFSHHDHLNTAVILSSPTNKVLVDLGLDMARAMSPASTKRVMNEHTCGDSC